MSRRPAPARILLVTGLSGAGKSTVLKTLEDVGWETRVRGGAVRE